MSSIVLRLKYSLWSLNSFLVLELLYLQRRKCLTLKIMILFLRLNLDVTLQWTQVMPVELSFQIIFKFYSDQWQWWSLIMVLLLRSCLVLKVLQTLKFFPKRWLSFTLFPLSNFLNKIIMISVWELSSLCWSWLVPSKEPTQILLKTPYLSEQWEMQTFQNSWLMIYHCSQPLFKICSHLSKLHLMSMVNLK